MLGDVLVERLPCSWSVSHQGIIRCSSRDDADSFVCQVVFRHRRGSFWAMNETNYDLQDAINAAFARDCPSLRRHDAYRSGDDIRQLRDRLAAGEIEFSLVEAS